MNTRSRKVTDVIRGIQHSSIKDAWESEHPEIEYLDFYFAVTHHKIPHLIVDKQYTYYKGTDPKCRIQVQVRDADSGQLWPCLMDCARDLGVSRTAVQQAIKRKGTCRGRHLQIVTG